MIYVVELELRNELAEQLGSKIDICVDNYSNSYKYLQEDLHEDFFIDFMKEYFDVRDEDFYVDNKVNPRYRHKMDLDEFALAVQNNHREMQVIPHNNVTVYYERSSQK